ncbi:MAG: hypothetical protein ACSHXB_00755 [Sulfitobacter sp.]
MELLFDGIVAVSALLTAGLAAAPLFKKRPHMPVHCAKTAIVHLASTRDSRMLERFK